MDCENCRHLTIVGLHDTGLWTGQDNPTGNGAEADRGKDGKTTSQSGLALNGTNLLRKAENREEWRKLVVECTVLPQRSAR